MSPLVGEVNVAEAIVGEVKFVAPFLTLKCQFLVPFLNVHENQTMFKPDTFVRFLNQTSPDLNGFCIVDINYSVDLNIKHSNGSLILILK